MFKLMYAADTKKKAYRTEKVKAGKKIANKKRVESNLLLVVFTSRN